MAIANKAQRKEGFKNDIYDLRFLIDDFIPFGHAELVSASVPIFLSADSQFRNCR